MYAYIGAILLTALACCITSRALAIESRPQGDTDQGRERVFYIWGELGREATSTSADSHRCTERVVTWEMYRLTSDDN